ncbi:MAG: asparagine synthase (glutamine-hydrolyzing) [Anaerohalosphaeraceae bacterium]
MCGITGICGLGRPLYPSSDVLLSMMAAIEHRGPDEAGMYLDDWAGLGHCRLSIIDLSRGSQPIHNENKTLWILFNGEIFNYPELRNDLLARGHRFYTETDTEVLLHLYEEKGASCLDELNGQFAMAVWDSRNKELFLARDRIGIQPLHYYQDENRLLFASEIKSLFQAPDMPRRLEPRVLDQIFTFWAPLPGQTVFQNVFELPPGHYLFLRNGQVTIRRWWDVPFGKTERTDLPFQEQVEKVDAILTDAVRIRLRADVPVGSYLSGGLDSSGVTAKIAGNFNNALRTFGIRFEHPDFDEGPYQDLMVRHLGVNHTETYASNKDIGQHLSRMIWYAEKPLLRTAPVPLLLLSEQVRTSGFKVVLTGEGADEFWGGYNIYKEAKLRRFWARQPQSARRPACFRYVYPYLFKDARLPHTIPAFFGKHFTETDNPFYSHEIRWLNTARIKTFFSHQLQDQLASYSCLEELRASLPENFSRWDLLSRAQYLEITLFLSNYLLSSQGDRPAMGNALEIRTPFLDHRMMEESCRIPPRWKIFGLREKFLLKKLFQTSLPEPIVSRSKHPYRAPIREILFQENPYHDELLSEKTLREFGLFDPEKTQKLLSAVRLAQYPNETNNMALVGILSTQILYEQFIKNFPFYPPKRPKRLTVFDYRTAPSAPVSKTSHCCPDRVQK